MAQRPLARPLQENRIDTLKYEVLWIPSHNPFTKVSVLHEPIQSAEVSTNTGTRVD